MHRNLFVRHGNICGRREGGAARVRVAWMGVAGDSAGTGGWQIGEFGAAIGLIEAGADARVARRAGGGWRPYCAQTCSAAWPKVV